MMRTAPLPPRLTEPVSPGIDDLVIKEAKRRAQARRRRLGIIAVTVAATAAATYWALDRAAPSPADDPAGAVAVHPALPGNDVAHSCLPPGQVPPVPESPWAGEGFVSDEPVSATASAASGSPCRLVVRYWFHRSGTGLSGMVFLYSDGRLIVDTATAQDWFVQWERRLTPAGVEHLRGAVARMLDDSPRRTAPGEFEASIRYRDGVIYPKDPVALMRLLVDRSLLADGEWVRKSPTKYRADWYLTCHGIHGTGSVDVRAAVRRLPSGARAVLASQVWSTLPPSSKNGAADVQCVVLSRAHAAVVVDALGGDMSVGTANVFPPGNASQFSVHALMPDGTSGAHGD